MRKVYHKKFIFSVVALAVAALVVPLSTKAASLEYASYAAIDQPSETAVISYGGLGNKAFYICPISTLLCTFYSSTTLPIYPQLVNPDLPLNPFSVIKDSRAVFRGFSPNGRFVFFYQYANSTYPTRSFVLIDNNSGKTYRTTSSVNYWDLLTEENRLFSVAPDSKTLIYLDDRSGYSRLYKVDLTKPSKTMMTGVPLFERTYSIADFLFIDSHTILFIANRDNPTIWNLYRYDLTSKVLTKIVDQVSYGEPMRKIGDSILFLQTKGNAVVPAAYSITNKAVSYFSLPQTPGITAVSNSYQTVQYGAVSGVLLKPPVTDKGISHPIIFWLHGGPYRDVSPTIHSYLSYGVYDWALEEARRNGAIVVKIDYRGSYGQGRTFAESLQGKAGISDVADVMTALAGVKKTLGSTYTISGNYVVGNSYGGYLALKTLVAHPTSFKGAISINGVTDWPTLLNKLVSSIFNVYFKGLPTLKNSVLYSQADIVEHLNVLTDQKMLLIQAQEDTDIDPHQADFFAEVAAERGKDVQVIKIADEDHIFHKPSSISMICFSTLSFIGLTPNSSDRCQYQ